uniref:Ig-like domain-containing protein n=1 Tax=Neolamprologus brichardi TaxID=32507 RepID=A0A3Q4GMJ9_NEOBR
CKKQNKKRFSIFFVVYCTFFACSVVTMDLITITGLKGSCLIIPCKFSYKNSQPNDLQVMWYLYQINGFPAVFKQGENVISKFDGRTSLIGSVVEQNCSLKIERLEMSHNHDRLYPWIDKNAITSYHTVGHSFYDGSTELIVSELNIIGTPRVGEQGTVSCSVRHACIFAPPTVTLNGIPGKDRITDTLTPNNTYTIVSNLTFIPSLSDDGKLLTCTAQFISGEFSTSATLTVKREFLHVALLIKYSKTNQLTMLCFQNRRSIWSRFSR